MKEEATHRDGWEGVPRVECHSGADLVRWIAEKIEHMGGVTLVGEGRENLCRRATPTEMVEFGGLEWVIEAQGLPNLIHELVHALFLGRLADDHGFDYGEIPLDLSRPEHRAHLWEELACCALSTVICAPMQADPQAFSDAWFKEQVEIQGVFHGLEHDLAAFVRRVDQTLSDPAHAAELEATVGRGRALVSNALIEVGGPGGLPACDALALWRRYRVSARLARP